MIKHKKTTTIKKEWRESVCVERQHTANKITELVIPFFLSSLLFLNKGRALSSHKKKDSRRRSSAPQASTI
jgi:hypothetical protein